jgi:hypothetical protein
MLKSARMKLFLNFHQATYQLSLMTDPLKVQEILNSEYGIQLSIYEIRTLQGRVPKLFNFGLIDIWATNQPQEALAWAASISWPNTNIGGNSLLQFFLDAARKTLPDLNRKTLDSMLPEGPGRAYVMDLAEATTDPYSLANRILAATGPAERALRLRALAQGWHNSETAADWARQNLTGAEKMAFYSQIGYKLAEQNPHAALQVLAELKGEIIEVQGCYILPQRASQVLGELTGIGYASTLGAMMRGLVEIGGQGQQVAELIASSDFNGRERARLISALADRWVRQDANAAVSWANTLTAPEDVRATIPYIVAQLDDDRVSRAVKAYLKNPDPVMELALIEAAAPSGHYFDPQKSRLILDPLISKDPALKLQWSKGRRVNKEGLLWHSVKLTAKRLAEVGPPAFAIEWLSTLPFASQRDYARVVGTVLKVWSLKSPTESAEWLQNSSLDPTLKSVLQKIVQP